MAAVAIMSPQHVQGISGRFVFKGDDDLLVDRLVAACQQTVEKPQLPGFGRDLVPYFGSDWNDALLVNGNKGTSKPSDAPAASAKKAAATNYLPPAAKSGGVKRGAAERKNKSPGKQDSPGRDGTRTANRQQKRTKPVPAARNAAEPTITCAPSAAPAPKEAPNLKRTSAPGALTTPGKAQGGPAGIWAGPSFCNSPTPAALPMPTSLLLRVASVPA